MSLAVVAYLAWDKSEPHSARPAATLLLLTGAALTLWTLIQVIPIPAGWLSVIAPANAEVWSRCLSPLKEPGPAWVTISLDPIATRIQVLRGVAYLLAFLAALRIAHRTEGALFLERALVASAVIMALAALLHPAFGASKVFGVYRPVNTYSFAPSHIGPLLNQNHLVGYVNLGMCVALGGVITSHPTMPRVLGGAAAALLIAVGVWGSSRGGMASAVAAAVMIVVVSRMATRSERRRPLLAVVAAAVTLLGVGMFVLASSEDAWQEVQSRDVTTKLGIAKQALGMTLSFPLFGIGRGAFESTFPGFRQGGGYSYWVFTHPENVLAQFVSEWGIPVGVAAIAAIAYALRPATLLARSRPPIGPWGAILCLALHNVVDFSCEIPAFMIALSVCAAIVVAGGRGSQTRTIDRWSERGTWLARGAAAAATAALLLAVFSWGRDLNSDQLAMRDRALDLSYSRDEFRAQVRRAMLGHPAEAYLPFTGALRAARANDESIVPWVGRALERSPVYGRAHFLLARWLFVRSPSQARLEYRLAMEQDTQLVQIPEMLPLVHGYDDARELVPSGPTGAVVIEGLVAALSSRLPATCVRLDADLSQATPDALPPIVRVAERAIADLAAGDAAPWCANDVQRCTQNGMALARRVSDRRPDACIGALLRARCMIEAGDAKSGLDELEALADRMSDRVDCEKKLVDVSIEIHDDARATRTLDRLGRAGCDTEADCGDHYTYLGVIEERRGNQRRALAFYKQGLDHAPEREDLLVNAARVASLVGLHAESLEDYEKLARRHPDQPAWAASVAAEREALGRGAVLPRR